MSLPFLRAESEETATQAAAFIGICIITVGLTVMNVTGAIAGSQGDSPGQIIIRVALAVILSGAELLAAVALVRVMLAANWWRQVAGSLIFLGLAWACIQNGKRAVHLIYPEFAESAALLKARAEIAGEDDKALKDAQAAAVTATPAELTTVRTRIATLEGHQELMQAKSPEKIMEAQTLLTITGDYVGVIDGKRERLTESAMRAYGEVVSKELKTLRQRETNLSNGSVIVAPVIVSGAEPVKTPAILQAEYEEKARKAASATIWLEVMLWVFEIARSFGLWALVTTITAKKKVPAEEITEAASPTPDGFIDMRFTHEDWAAHQQAMEDAKRREKEAADARSDAAKWKAPIPIAHKGWVRDKKREIIGLHESGASPNDIYEATGFGTWNEFEAFVRKVFNKKAAGKILGQPSLEAPDPRAPVAPEPTTLGDYMPEPETPEPPVAMADSPQEDEPEPEVMEDEAETDDELTIPDEPKEWGLAVYEADLNNEDTDEGAKRDELV